MVKQEPFYTVVDWCANELLEVSKLLPVTYTDQANDYGRATSLWALAMRARLLTFAASPLVNGNPKNAGIVNCDGEPIFTSKYDPYRWQDAAKANKELIDAAVENGYRLYEARTKEGDLDPYMSYFGATMLRRNQDNFEIIMPRTEDGAGWMDRKSAPKSIQSESGVFGVTQDLVDAFFMANGKVAITGHNADGSPIINAESGYSETGYSTDDMKAKTAYFYNDPTGIEGRSENVITEKGTYNMYCNREPRFYISVMYNDSFNWAKTHKDQTAALPPRKNVNFYFNGEDGKSGSDYPTAGYLMKKRIAPDYLGSSSSGQYNKRHGVVYRLAEAYLAYAECLYEFSVSEGIGQYSNNKAEIFQYINLIRRRAGIPEYSFTNEGGKVFCPKTKNDLLNRIRRERIVELAFEWNRFFDVRRWKVAEGNNDPDHWIYPEYHKGGEGGNVYGMNMDKDYPDFFARTLLENRANFSKKQYFMPIPYDDIRRIPELVQNLGW